eukprot:TRINITY_DN32840_c0_g1_i1.p1 TRINITY_DN32840_c0_g1~~TRINITY_DN32840_c0_g1_i1.p1  ORF type:complete len:433 (-),score=64.63 TRINITY_DN32840_c0_g1_i1:165-1394(-)
MTKQWWSASQERLKDQLVLFPWQGHPRWPGIVVPPYEKSKLLAGEGFFYPPQKSVLDGNVHVADRRGALQVNVESFYEVKHNGKWRPATLHQLNPDGTVDAEIEEEETGVDPSPRLFVDDLPRTSIREATRKGVSKRQTCAAGQQKFGKQRVRQTKRDSTFVLVYSLGDEMYRWARASSLKDFACAIKDVYSYKGQKNTARQHLISADVAPFDGKSALRAAEEELRRRQQEAERSQEQQMRESAYRSMHGLPTAPCSADYVADCRPTLDHRRLHGAATPQKRKQLEEPRGCSEAKRSRIPDFLRGEVTSYEQFLDHGETSERYSADELKRSLAVLGLEGLGKLPTETQLRKAFRDKARSCHPDKVAGHLKAWATAEMQRVNEAYRVVLANISGKLSANARGNGCLMLGC